MKMSQKFFAGVVAMSALMPGQPHAQQHDGVISLNQVPLAA
jgi:hypothetical protein